MIAATSRQNMKRPVTGKVELTEGAGEIGATVEDQIEGRRWAALRSGRAGGVMADDALDSRKRTAPALLPR